MQCYETFVLTNYSIGLNLLLELLEFDHKSRTRADYALQHPYFTPRLAKEGSEDSKTHVE